MNMLLPARDDDIDVLTIGALFRADRYVVPRYQRNYAWGPAQVEQLLRDVLDTANTQDGRDYYIGSLVTYRRMDGVYETIDGQQRHTTLAIVLAVLATVHRQDLGGIAACNLHYDIRPRSEATLKRMFESVPEDVEEASMGLAHAVATRFFAPHDRETIGRFTRTLLERVKVLRVVVPADTDLNHYFEIMNNRGEQLEKHEVLKARLMSQLSPGREQTAFSVVWDACADMRRHVQMGFAPALRVPLFGAALDCAPRDFAQMSQLLAQPQDAGASTTLADLLAAPAGKPAPPPVPEPEEAAEEEERAAIVTFPHFLLYALHGAAGIPVRLDDKGLLDAFEEHTPDPRAFIVVLLEYRLLFDRYVVRRWDGTWKLKALRCASDQQSFWHVDSIEDPALRTQLTMLLSMFHVSYPSQSYKHWLDATLLQLCQGARVCAEVDASYADWLERLGRRLLRLDGGSAVGDMRLPAPAAGEGEAGRFDPASLPRGTAVPNFVFNWLDYLLWKRLRDPAPLEGVDMGYVRERLKRFEFSFRSSVEHYYPQHPKAGEDYRWADCDRFGNLCLISHSRNSSLNNHLPSAKKDHYQREGMTESLKQTFMMSYPEWDPKTALETIDAHERMMFALLEA